MAGPFRPYYIAPPPVQTPALRAFSIRANLAPPFRTPLPIVPQVYDPRFRPRFIMPPPLQVGLQTLTLATALTPSPYAPPIAPPPFALDGRFRPPFRLPPPLQRGLGTLTLAASVGGTITGSADQGITIGQSATGAVAIAASAAQGVTIGQTATGAVAIAASAAQGVTIGQSATATVQITATADQGITLGQSAAATITQPSVTASAAQGITIGQVATGTTGGEIDGEDDLGPIPSRPSTLHEREEQTRRRQRQVRDILERAVDKVLDREPELEREIQEAKELPAIEQGLLALLEQAVQLVPARRQAEAALLAPVLQAQLAQDLAAQAAWNEQERLRMVAEDLRRRNEEAAVLLLMAL